MSDKRSNNKRGIFTRISILIALFFSIKADAEARCVGRIGNLNALFKRDVQPAPAW
jgi:hypothetical protein